MVNKAILKSKSKSSNLFIDKKKFLTVSLVLFLLIVVAISIYFVYSSTVNGNNSIGTTIADGEISGTIREGVVQVDPGNINAMAGLGNNDEGLIVLPETGTVATTNIYLTGGVSLRVNPGNCDRSNITGFVVVQNLAGYVYRSLSVGYGVYRTNSWQYPANFSVYQGAPVSLGTVPSWYFSSYTMKTQNFVYYIDKAGNRNFIEMVLSSPISLRRNSTSTSAFVSIQLNCKSGSPVTAVPTIPPVQMTSIPTPIPTLAPTCLPNCRP